MWWIIAIRRVPEGYVVDFYRDSLNEHRPGIVVYKIRFNNSILTTDIFRDLYTAFQVKKYEKYYCFLCDKAKLINYIYNLLNNQRPFTDVSETEYTYFVTDRADFISHSDIESIIFDKTHGYYLRRNSPTWTPLSLAELVAEQSSNIEKSIKSMKSDDFATADNLLIEFDVDAIMEDIKFIGNTTLKFATPEYHEHIVRSANQQFIFNAQTAQFYIFNSASLVVSNSPIERKRFNVVGNKTSVHVAENIIDVFIGIGRRKILKDILRSMLVKKSEKTNIIYDYGSHYITKWLLNIAECLLSSNDYAIEPEQIKAAHRLIVTDNANLVEEYKAAGVKNIVVRVEGGESCNITKASTYFKINSQHIIQKSMTFHTFCENLFRRTDLFQTEFILWSVS